MAAFGATQGGKAGAHESQPARGHVAKSTDAPKGDCASAAVPKGGTKASTKGFGK